MAAGTSSRFVPLSFERPKGLLEVKGEILIERQIRQLREAGIRDITIVVGYKAGMFEYLREKYDVRLVMNEDFAKYNNTSSLIRVLDLIGNTYICSSDNYFPENVFIENPQTSYYSAKYAEGTTDEYCITTDKADFIESVGIGGHDSWYMIGHVYFSEEFSKAFSSLLRKEYEKESVRKGYWEDLYTENIQSLPGMRIKRFENSAIEEFDNLDELRLFDSSYQRDSRSDILKTVADLMDCRESDLYGFSKIKDPIEEEGFCFFKGEIPYKYLISSKKLVRL